MFHHAGAWIGAVFLWSQICGCARIRSQAGFGYGSGWTRRHQPGNLVEIEKVEQVWLSGVARGERSSSQEAGLHEFDDRGVIHGDVGDIVFPHERRNYKI